LAQIVFLSVPAYGHLNPVLPIIAELVRRGHAVTVYDEPPFEAVFRATGADFVAYPKAMSMEDMAAVLMRGDLIETFELFVHATSPLYDFCFRQLRGKRPDALVIDGIALWGEMVGRRLHIPTVVTSPFLAYGLSRESGSRELKQMLASLLRRLGPIILNWIRVGLKGVQLLPLHWPLLPVRGDLTLMLTSKDLHPRSPMFDKPRWVFTGASIDPRTRTDTFDFSRLDGRPVIYISLGTLIFGKSDFYERCMAALADYPAQVLMSVGRGTDLGRFAKAPPNFIVAESFPQLEVLERADMFITPAGLNSVHEALWYGVPMVAMPQHFEQLHNAEAMSRGGAGITLVDETDGRVVSAEMLRETVEAIAADLAGYKQRAAKLGQTLRDGGGYVEAANRIEKMIGTK